MELQVYSQLNHLAIFMKEKEDHLFMVGRYIKVLFAIIIILFSLTLSGCLYDPNPYYNAAFHTHGTTWKSSNPEIWFTVKEDGTNSGEFNYNGKILKIQTGSRGGIVAILLLEADGDKELERIMNENGSTLISTSIHSCSKTKLVLNVNYSNLPDFHDTQIIFTRSQ